MAVEYGRRKDVIAVDPVNGFVKDLRNYALHRTLPWLGHSVSFGAGAREMTAVTSLGSEELRAWDGWRGPAKRFLDMAGETVDLRSTITEHARLVDGLGEWVFAQFRGLHRADVAGAKELVDELDWLLSGGREGRPRLRR